MNRRRFTVAAAALVTASSFIGGTAAAVAATTAPAPAAVHPNTFIGRDDGYGPTPEAAQRAAQEQLTSDYYGCKPPFYLVSEQQLPDGTWWAQVAENGCVGYY